jgi:hypothetical protein
MSSVAFASEAAVAELQVAIQEGNAVLGSIFEKATYIELRLDESQGKSSDLFRHIQQSLEEFDAQLGGSVQFEKIFYSLFESFSKNRLLQGLSGAEKLKEFKVLVKAAQMESFETVCWNKFHSLLDIRLLEMKMAAQFEDGLEEQLKKKVKQFEKDIEASDKILQNCFRPELLRFIEDVEVSSSSWNFQSPATFQMMVTFRRFKNMMAYLQHWSEKKVLFQADIETILQKPAAVEPMPDYNQPTVQVLSDGFEALLQDAFSASIKLN